MREGHKVTQIDFFYPPNNEMTRFLNTVLIRLQTSTSFYGTISAIIIQELNVFHQENVPALFVYHEFRL